MTVEALLRGAAEESGLVEIGFCRADPFSAVEADLGDGPRNDGRYLKRNAIVALGNSGTIRNWATLLGFLGTSDPLLRSHPAWALGRIGGSSAGDALASARRSERNETVLRQIDLVLGTLG
ncbi:MAG: HEAT repeat domain-containing protein [Acidimicrobiia bacterium]